MGWAVYDRGVHGEGVGGSVWVGLGLGLMLGLGHLV